MNRCSKLIDDYLLYKTNIMQKSTYMVGLGAMVKSMPPKDLRPNEASPRNSFFGGSAELWRPPLLVAFDAPLWRGCGFHLRGLYFRGVRLETRANRRHRCAPWFFQNIHIHQFCIQKSEVFSDKVNRLHFGRYRL